MPLNIVEPNLEKVKPDLRALYVKDTKSGNYRLDLSDLKTYLESHVSSLENELKLIRENEQKLCLSVALRQVGIYPHYEQLVIANIRDRVAIGTRDERRVVRISDADGGTPMVGSGPNGLATLDDLMKETVKLFPTMFKNNAGGGRDAPLGARTLTRTEFNAMTPIEQRQKVMVEKCVVVDDQAGARSVARPASKPGEKVISRQAFDKLDPAAQYRKVQIEGYRLVD